jgi:hypothetical protein
MTIPKQSLDRTCIEFLLFLIGSTSHLRPCSTNTKEIMQAALHSVSRAHSPVLMHRDSRAWSLQVWVSFGIAVFLCGVGLAYLPGKDLDRAFMVMGYFFCLSAAFVLAKFVRDNEKASPKAALPTRRCSALWCGAASFRPWRSLAGA